MHNRLITITPAFAARQIIDTMSDALIVLDREGIIRLVNQTACAMFGLSEENLVGKLPSRAMDSNQTFAGVLEALIQGELVSTLEMEFFRPEEHGTGFLSMSASIMRDPSGVPLSVVCVIHDITRQRKLEKELLKAQKLESLGVLAGGIAHDFNNILTAIMGNISLARLRAEPGDKLDKWLGDAEKATERAKDLTQQLLTFSKGGAPVKRVITLEDPIRDSASFALRGTAVKPEFLFAADLWPVEADEGQMVQVFNNLIINASQAMPAGGIITITATNVHVNANDSMPLTAGNHIKITVADQGSGIPADNLGRIFDPYFTTKEHGSGLGLAVTYSVVKNHGGHILVESDSGAGTTFTIYLPASDKTIDASAPVAEVRLGGKGRVLLMDDEDIILAVGREMLEELGYDVAIAKDGAAAVKLFSEAGEAGKPFSGVVLDLTIPGGMGGKEAIGIIRKLGNRFKRLFK